MRSYLCSLRGNLSHEIFYGKSHVGINLHRQTDGRMVKLFTISDTEGPTYVFTDHKQKSHTRCYMLNL